MTLCADLAISHVNSQSSAASAWSSPAAAPLRKALRSPQLYSGALSVLSKSPQSDTFATCAPLEVAVDWVLFVLRAAGHDAWTAHCAILLLRQATYGIPEGKERRLLKVVRPVLATMRTHRRDADIIGHGLSALLNLSTCCKCVKQLREAGAVKVVERALKDHPNDSDVQDNGKGVLASLSDPVVASDPAHQAPS